MLLLPPRASIAPKLHWISMQVTQLRGSDTHRTSAQGEENVKGAALHIGVLAHLDNFLSSAQQRHPAIPSRVLKALVSFAEERKARTTRTRTDCGVRTCRTLVCGFAARRCRPKCSGRRVVNCLRRLRRRMLFKERTLPVSPRVGTALPNVHLLNPL